MYLKVMTFSNPVNFEWQNSSKKSFRMRAYAVPLVRCSVIPREIFNFHHPYTTIHDTTGGKSGLKTGTPSQECSLPFRSSRGEHRIIKWIHHWSYRLISSSSFYRFWTTTEDQSCPAGATSRAPPPRPGAGSGRSWTSAGRWSSVSEAPESFAERGEG